MPKVTKNPLGLVFQEAFGIRMEDDEAPDGKEPLDVTLAGAPREPRPPERPR